MNAKLNMQELEEIAGGLVECSEGFSFYYANPDFDGKIALQSQKLREPFHKVSVTSEMLTSALSDNYSSDQINCLLDKIYDTEHSYKLTGTESEMLIKANDYFTKK